MTTTRSINNWKFIIIYQMGAYFIIGYFIIVVCIGISTAAGIGGGVLFIPILILYFGYGVANSAVVVSIMVLINSAYKVLSNMGMSHPIMKRAPLVDYSAVCIMAPTLMFSTKIGISIREMLPAFPLTVILIMLFIFLSIKVYAAAKKKMAEEMQSPKKLSNIPNQEIIKHEEQQYDGLGFRVFAYSISASLMLPLVTYLLGNKKSKSLFLARCSVEYWIMFALYGMVAVSTSYKCLNMIKLKKHIPKYSKFSNSSYILIASILGMLCGIFGIGGGSVINPIFLQMGYAVQCSSATSMVLILLASVATTFQNLIYGELHLGNSYDMALITLIATVVLTKLINSRLPKGKTYLLIFALFTALSASSFLMFIKAVKTYADATDTASLFKFAYYC